LWLHGTTKRGRTEGRRARGKIFDSDRRSRQSTSKTSTLYDATREVAERLEAFWLAGFEKWGETRASRYGLFGSAELAPYLDTLTEKCERIRELSGQINAIFKQKITLLVAERWPTQAKDGSLLTLIESDVQQESPFLCIPTVNEPHRSTVSQVWENTNNQTEVKKEDCLDMLHALKKDLLVNPWSRHTIERARKQ